MSLVWLAPDSPFPPVERALSEPAGLLAVGADLSPARLQTAYSQGIFPWFGDGEPILWWSPDPRMVLRCADFSPGHSLRKTLRRLERMQDVPTPSIQVRVDTAFDAVIEACAAPRSGQPGTWITADMQDAYRAWHHAGAVHSIETWIDGTLSGGLYGVSLGRMFFGESMFTRQTDASKIALAYLVRFLVRHDVPWIDCQQQTRHLASLGAAPVDRGAFVAHLGRHVAAPRPPWQPGILRADGTIAPLG